ncbi:MULTISPECIES: Na/Pi symporter [unclassified Burkholderia]|uniref:Na/Pi cotransporter family protein n=1 Tax=unclassified Burkholderia TaxID=2613784 RepID=UPI0014243554|nr:MULTISPECIES: Na/Pi symporter [unclassified Burkholderia]NIE61546.1 Na/Pi cotransporter family protein [Burkholderia sp. Ap-955]NIF13932.1 Na/Pi cotransporter family protein [Burkholderia sp. Ax-1735]NIG07046.1 Na/Pi cotransporter family protein [Burkholderia sp. Tr-849]
MTFTFTLIDLAGSIALVLLGTQMLQTGMQRAFGAGLRSLLERALYGRLPAFFGGMGVTAVLQGSSTTAVMTAELTAQGRVGLVPALAVMLGANVGTTLIVQALSFEVETLSPALILVGMLMFRKVSNTRAHELGRMFIGLGLLLLALHHLQELMTDYEDAPSLRLLLSDAATVPLIDVLLAAGLTWAADSNVAIVLLIMSLCAQNVIPPDTAFALVLGANLGAAIHPVLEGAATHDPASRRLPVGNLLVLSIGVVMVLGALTPIGCVMVRIEPDNARVVADFHTLFNLSLACLFLPLLIPYADLLTRLLPSPVKVSDAPESQYIDPLAGQMPEIPPGTAAHDVLPVAYRQYGIRSRAHAASIVHAGMPVAEVRTRDDVLDNVRIAPRTSLTFPDAGQLAGFDGRYPHEGRDRLQEDAQHRVEIRECAGHALECIDTDGNTQTYYPAKSLWLTLQDIQVVRRLEPAGGTTHSTLSTYVQGTASLDDCCLAIIGKAQNNTRTIHITFAAREIGVTERRGLRELQDELGIALSDDPLGTARLGYNESDDEMQEPAQWWALCDVPASSMQALADGVEARQVTAVKTGLCLRGVYTSIPSGAAPTGGFRAFLRPGKDGSTLEASATASGYVVYLAIDLPKVSLPGESRSAQVPVRTDDRSPIGALTEKLDNVFTGLKWLAALVAILVVVLLLKWR